jgi:hypothetical protein
MCNCDSDLNCVPKYKPKYNWFDRFVLSSVFLIVSICLGFMTIALLNPEYFMCN